MGGGRGTRRGIVVGARAAKAKLGRAREFRSRPTPSEALAWELVRNRRCLGLKFRRQQVVRGFIVDFYCAEHRIALEIDGPIHDDPHQLSWDRARSRYLAELDIREVRIPSEELSATNLATRLVALLPLSREGEGAGG